MTAQKNDKTRLAILAARGDADAQTLLDRDAHRRSSTPLDGDAEQRPTTPLAALLAGEDDAERLAGMIAAEMGKPWAAGGIAEGVETILSDLDPDDEDYAGDAETMLAELRARWMAAEPPRVEVTDAQVRALLDESPLEMICDDTWFNHGSGSKIMPGIRSNPHFPKLPEENITQWPRIWMPENGAYLMQSGRGEIWSIGRDDEGWLGSGPDKISHPLDDLDDIRRFIDRAIGEIFGADDED